MAHRQHKSLQECQESVTSTEFLDWIVFLEKEEWQDNGRLEYYLAQIAAEVRRFREGFSKNPKSVSVDDCLLKFERTLADGSKAPTNSNVPGVHQTAGRRQIEIGDPKALADPRWAKVNANAKAAWAAFVGLKELS